MNGMVLVSPYLNPPRRRRDAFADSMDDHAAFDDRRRNSSASTSSTPQRMAEVIDYMRGDFVTDFIKGTRTRRRPTASQRRSTEMTGLDPALVDGSAGVSNRDLSAREFGAARGRSAASMTRT